MGTAIAVKRNSDLTFEINAPWINHERWLMFRADVHNDHPFSLRNLAKEHIDTALEREAVTIDGGDFYCAMQTPADKRAAPQGTMVRDEDRGPNYLIKMAEHGAEQLEPYLKTLTLMGLGNHETGIMKFCSTNLTYLTTKFLRAAGGHVLDAGYRFYVKLNFSKKHYVILYCNHGSRGNAPVTRGVIQTNRRAVYIRDADFVLTGDIHDGWSVPIVRETFDGKKVGRHTQWHLQTPSYKEVLMQQAAGFETEKEFAPKPLGCWFIRFVESGSGLDFEIVPKFK